MSAESPWQAIRARSILVGDVVSVLGLTSHNSAIVHVDDVEHDRRNGQVTVYGRQPWGNGWRYLSRTMSEDARAERLVSEPALEAARRRDREVRS